MEMKKLILALLAYALHSSAAAQIDHPAHRFVGTDSVETYVSGQYKANSFLRHLLMGKNYRNVWSQKVILPVFRLSATDFKITELGGGMQTKSLKLQDKDGREWALRTLDKDVSGALGASVENTIVQKVTQDQISAAMPYAPSVIGPLAKSAGVRAAEPTIYFVTDDPAFGQYRSIFANTVCMLEERDPGFKTTDNTEEMLNKILQTNTHVVQQKVLLKARLLDMIVADWDRHFDNWRWGIRDSGGIHYYYAIPRDRDWAFYHSNGFVPKLARLLALRFLINFGDKLDYVKSLNYKAHTFDRVFLNGLSADDWREVIHQLQQNLGDTDIENAVKELPPAVFASLGSSFIHKLKGRRDDLEGPALRYYRFLSRVVQIEGSGTNEIFTVDAAGDGFRLQIHQLRENGSKGAKTYDRTFLRSETHQVVLNGLGGNDRFVVAEAVQSKIRLELNGGEGKDSYDLNGDLRIAVNEDKASDHVIVNKNKSKIHFR